MKFKYLILIHIAFLGWLAGCTGKYVEVFEPEQHIQVLIADREFLVPKKYIDNPSLPVQSPLTFDKNGSMIAYFYFPSLSGLTETDAQQRFGRFNHQVISMQWYIKSEHYIDAKKSGNNILESPIINIVHKDCEWASLSCLSIKDPDFFKWVGSYQGIGSFYIRCHIDRENPQLLPNQVCNLYLDYDDKDIYIESLISSNFITDKEALPKVMMQMKAFIDEWEESP
ncbi:hypothetical protein SAMN05421749_102474 [Acinetobacter marinus]|uniref:Lipoprotein n=1 Tax=Acinetobacter marinus TaxID=281375 RepID=A0A1G6HS65_9GAMM|nr:hypothetical protein [Acinetobacter marinus]SDB97129.1 hypothetical protein SAMN05421749_102474 [Acinetobacter marinus]